MVLLFKASLALEHTDRLLKGVVSRLSSEDSAEKSSIIACLQVFSSYRVSLYIYKGTVYSEETRCSA